MCPIQQTPWILPQDGLPVRSSLSMTAGISNTTITPACSSAVLAALWFTASTFISYINERSHKSLEIKCAVPAM